MLRGEQLALSDAVIFGVLRRFNFSVSESLAYIDHRYPLDDEAREREGKREQGSRDEEIERYQTREEVLRTTPHGTQAGSDATMAEEGAYDILSMIEEVKQGKFGSIILALRLLSCTLSVLALRLLSCTLSTSTADRLCCPCF